MIKSACGIPVIEWEQPKENDQSSNVIQLFPEKESLVQQIDIKTDEQKELLNITRVSSGFGEITMLHRALAA